MTREEFISVINENIEDNEKAVKVLEAFDDYSKGIDVEGLSAEIEKIRSEKDEILARYRERFSEGNTVGEPDNSDETTTEDEDEDEIIDIKELD